MRVRAPELPQDAAWLNGEPLTLRSQRGKVVLLDFWTYGCINCLHTLDDLHWLAQKYGSELVILGVHTAKFEREQSPAAVAQAVARYGIDHPVLVDRDRTVWDQYAVKAWPTFVVIDPQGYVVATLAGEGQRQRLDTLIQSLVASSETPAPGSLDFTERHEPFGSEAPAQDLGVLTPLSFPGKVLADASSKTLFIADTGHHRLVIAGLSDSEEGSTQANVQTVIGTGQAGWHDGPWESAQFRDPQGLAYDAQRQVLYVADTGNHRVRQVDLARQQVSTVAGTGTQSGTLFPHGGNAMEVALNSPWDVVLVDEMLYVAMAGAHQIWQIDLHQGRAQTLIGTGAEYCVDGPPEQAAFAQPSGLAYGNSCLCVADSETSSIRTVALTSPPLAHTLCGSGELFEFGDRDGAGLQARLQHCLGVAWGDDSLWVADTYNHKIKRVNPGSGLCQRLCGSGQAGNQDGPFRGAQFSEPGGLAYTPGYLYVADTNNHAIRQIDLRSRTVSTLTFPTLCSPYVCLPNFPPKY
ncbi:MAG TPA: thioredoxin-like domain-containing protein [Trichocoleus sp.]